jgi:hypothetical protein
MTPVSRYLATDQPGDVMIKPGGFPALARERIPGLVTRHVPVDTPVRAFESGDKGIGWLASQEERGNRGA